MGLHRLLPLDSLRTQLHIDHLIVSHRFIYVFLSPSDQNSSGMEGDVLKTVRLPGQEMWRPLYCLQNCHAQPSLALIVASLQAENAELVINSPAERRPLPCRPQRGAGRAAGRAGQMAAAQSRAAGFVSGAQRRESSPEQTPSPLLLHKTDSPFVRTGRW